MNELVFKSENGQVVTTSLKVAETFHKDHARVLRDIRELACSQEFRQGNFAESSYLNNQNKEQPLIVMSKDGFTLLAMGYTGKKAMKMIDSYRKNPAQYLMYTMIGNDFDEALNRLSHWKTFKRVRIVAQPFRDVDNPHQIVPQWQKDMARWAMRREIYTTCDFRDYEPRKGFKCGEYFN